MTRLALLALLVPASALADGVDKATAEALFLRAKQHEKAGDFATACPLYESSYRADPQLGALLNLANCHEQIGKLATAWAEFREALEIANRRADYRRDFAQRRADELAPRVSWLAITAPSTSGLVVWRDAHDVTLVVGQELPIDPGTYVVTATAPRRAPWKTTIAITEPGTHAVVSIPPLADESPVATSNEPRATTRPMPAHPAPRASSRLPYVVGGAGLVMVATGLVFGARAYSQWNDSRDPSLCDARNVCNADGERLIASAKDSATLGTYFVAGGGAVVAASVVWWAVTRDRGERVEVVPEVSPGSVGLAVGGRF